jgi:hypothetical protein
VRQGWHRQGGGPVEIDSNTKVESVPGAHSGVAARPQAEASSVVRRARATPAKS